MIKVIWPRAQLEAWVAKAKGKTKEFAVEFIQDISQEVVIATPVKTGFLRGSWYGTINGGAVGTVSGGGFSLSLEDLNLGDIYTMANGAAYAARIEYGFVGVDSLGRHYNQQPRAFIRGTVDRAPEIAEAAAERVAAT